MRARQAGDVLVFELEGQLDFETTQNLHEQCTSLMKQKNTQKVVFEMGKLQFVGSSGIARFIQIMKEFNRTRGNLKMCNLSAEFSKMFKAYQTTRHPFEIYETEEEAMQAYVAPPTRRSRKKRIAN